LRNAGAKERCHAARDNVYRPCGPCGFAGACQFWICTARYNFQDLTANNNPDCVQLPSDIGRPLTETSDVHAVTGSAAIGAFLPVFWFIEPTSGEVQFCATSPRSYAAAPG
jgi:hypothetical protein